MHNVQHLHAPLGGGHRTDPLVQGLYELETEFQSGCNGGDAKHVQDWI
jgi:hypothetical protein